MSGGPYSNISFNWGSTVPARPDYMPRIPFNPRAAAHCVCDDFLNCRRCERMRSPIISHNTIVNPRIHRRGDDWEGPVTH